MRALLLLIIVAALGVISITSKPRVAGYGYIWFALLRPDQLAWVVGVNYYSMFLALCVILGAFRMMVPGMEFLFRSKLAIGLMVLLVVSGICTVTAVNQTLALEAYWDFFRATMVLIMIPMLLRTPEEVRTMFFVAGGSIGVLGVKFGGFGLIHGGVRLVGSYGHINDNNFVALLLVVGVPLCWYSASMLKRKWMRLAAFVFVFFSIVGVVLTFSRGGTLALAVALLLIALRSRHKVLVVTILAISVVPVVYLAGAAYADRIATVTDPMSEQSAASRIYLIKIGFNMWRDHPVFGVGFGRTNQQLLMPQYYGQVVDSSRYAAKVLHNTYIQMLADCGALGITVYMAILLGAIYSMGRSARRTVAELRPVPLGLQTSLIAFAVGSVSISAMPTFAAFPVLITIAACWQAVAKQAEQPPAGETNSTLVLREVAPAYSR
jgi:probable O-glycosylation ligase (exosortase A-associated)